MVFIQRMEKLFSANLVSKKYDFQKILFNFFVKVPCTKIFQLKQHNETNKHQENVERQQSTSRQPFLAETFQQERDPFVEDLCDALVGANIPFNKLKNQSLNYFLSKYTNRRIPDESTLRKNYLDVCFRQVFILIESNDKKLFSQWKE